MLYTCLRWSAYARAHVRTPLPYLANGWADCVQTWCVANDPLDERLTQVRCGVHLHVRTCTPPSNDGASSPARPSPIKASYWLLRAEREARSESTSIYRRKVSMSGRPAVVTLFERLFLWNGMTNSRTVILIRCHHPINHLFDRYRYPLVPATARGTCRGESVEDTLSLGNSTTAGSIVFKFGV